MRENIFDYYKEEPAATVTTSQQEEGNGPLGGAIGGLFAMLVLVAIMPIYIHGLVKIAIWSWNLI